MHMSAPLVIFSAGLLMLAASTGALAQGDPAARSQHLGVERILLGNMVEVRGDTIAETMTCSKDDGKNCLMAKDAQGNEVEVIVSEVQTGGKLTCMEQQGLMRCQKDPLKSQQDAMKKP